MVFFDIEVKRKNVLRSEYVDIKEFKYRSETKQVILNCESSKAK
jgi:hypothetical protein